MYKKILIANRGEIACRIARTLRNMGIAVATVHSTADAQALHVQEIGESILIGKGPARESYLDIDAVIRAAQAVGADAIHPGFGFLSENPQLARRCSEVGIAFIGPSPQVLELFGDKATAKALAQQHNIPTAGGLLEPTDDIDKIMAAVQALKLPCIVKAVAGGGGKGMRVIRSLDQAKDAAMAAIREGLSSFGDGRLIVERYLNQPRHIEVQILGDGQGGVIHLFDRECSLQRRHQKVVEEAPVCSISDTMRQTLWNHAVTLGKATNYLGLGTVEFAVTEDAAVFLEVNPRLQVEHPVTECITGLDLVELQVMTVFERRLPLRQDQLRAAQGHAVQARLYAEDPEQGFLPSTGRIQALRFCDSVRTDTGVTVGSEISSYYDPMIAKVIAHDTTRNKALNRLRSALWETSVLGVTSNRGFLLGLLADPRVQSNEVNTETIDKWLADKGPQKEDDRHVAALMAIWRSVTHRSGGPSGAWHDNGLTGWRMFRGAHSDEITLRYGVTSASTKWRVGFGASTREGEWPVRVNDHVFFVSVDPIMTNGSHVVSMDGHSLQFESVCLEQRDGAPWGMRNSPWTLTRFIRRLAVAVLTTLDWSLLR
ncbi:ATP-grasp domain-containing protein [Polaromonas sp. P1(28)-13]|nr:ATP-grasp domain-containing protein [Polaromonas sp. P1(28)-13]